MTMIGKKILVTGADGFIGSHLAERLCRLGAQVRAFVLYNSFGSWGWLDHLPETVIKEMEIVTGDVRDFHCVHQAMDRCQMVFHLAALIAIPYSYRTPDSYMDTNIKGTLNVLNAARDQDVSRVFITSTSEVYGSAKYVPIDENHPYQGQSPYSATKIGADRMAEAYYRSYNLPVTIVRPFNTYGPRQSARAIIPTVITQLLNGAKELTLGSLSPTRDFNYVLDTVDGFIEIAESNRTIGEEINIATQVETSIEDLIQLIINQHGTHARIVSDRERVRPKKSEVERLLGANDKIMRLTNWQPKYSLKEGIAETIEWFSDPENLRRYKSTIYNI